MKFKACDARKTAVYKGVNEDFEGERNAEITLLNSFFMRIKNYWNNIGANSER